MVEASNRTVRVVGFVNPPFLLNCFTSYPNGCTNPGPGLDAEYIYVVLHYLMDYNVQWIRVKDRNAMYNALETGAADFTGVGAPLIEEYFGKFQNTPVYLFDAIALVVKSRSASAAADFHAVAFVETDVWFLFTITLLSIYMLSHISKYIYEVYAFEQDFSRKNRLISFLRSFRETIIYTFAFISVIFFLNLVSNIITVYLVKKDERIEYGFDNLNELGRLLLRKKCRFTMLTSIKDDPIFHHLLINPKAEDEIPWTGLFRRAFVKNPPLYVDNRFEMGKLITKSSLCYIGVDLSSLKEFYESRFCFVKVISIVKETSRLQSVFYYREEALESKLSLMSTKALRMFYAGRAAIYSRPNKTRNFTANLFPKPLHKLLSTEAELHYLMWENSTVTAQSCQFSQLHIHTYERINIFLNSVSNEKINQSQNKKAPIIKTIISEGKQKWNKRVIDFLKPTKKIHITQAVPVADVSGNGETIAAEFKEVVKTGGDHTTAKIDLPVSAAVIEQEQENSTTQHTVHDVTTDNSQSADNNCDNCWTVRYGTLAIVVLEATALVSWFVLHIVYSSNNKDAFSISWRGVVALLLLTVIAMVVIGVLTNRAWLLWPHIAIQMAGICTGMVLTLSTVLVMSVGSEASDYLFAKLFSPESVPWFEKLLGPIWPFCLAVIFNFVTALGLWFYTVNKRCQMHLRSKEKRTQVSFLKLFELLKSKGSQLASAGQTKP
ncbi:hypothetical protein T01_3634 [Trichinella spiralis]|uniref:Uncharacterized protein n=2 Tax=Trichinella spiralis TaxID=6334 RepID=A0A0V1BMQ9_TRISP|nr:hypothetical protein T01_3634 [Trichinella spiralis]